MTAFFSEETINKINAGREDVHKRNIELREKFLSRIYRSGRGREFAVHGFCRRLASMARAIDLVFEKLPPELSDIPDRPTVTDATIAIHSFVLNAFGCLDNLAWIWVCEKPVLAANGNELPSLKVGLGPKCADVRASFSQEFVGYLDSRQVWVDNYLKGFRDSLAHRIPLYIPPYIITPERLADYTRLEEESAEALRNLQLDNCERLQAEQKELGIWRPWMTHSVSEKSPSVVFHAQLIADFLTIDEFGLQMLEEFARQGV